MAIIRKPKYDWVAISADGFVRQLAGNILRHGYRFYVAGEIKPTTDVSRFDEVIQEKFSYNMSRSERWRRKNACGPDGDKLGLANVHYLRFKRFYVLIATEGKHPFFDAHSKVTLNKRGEVVKRETFFRDAHRDPVLFPFEAGGRQHCYSIRVVPEGALRKKALWQDANVPEYEGKPRVRVQIGREAFSNLQADFVARAASSRWPVGVLEAEIFELPYLPYRSVRDQLWGLVRRMNRVRKQRGLSGTFDPFRCVRFKIPPVRTFQREVVTSVPEVA